MNTVNFITPGELDIRGAMTFGISVKEGDNPIGYFGTGLKYALAVLLREHQRVTIFVGDKRYNVRGVVEEFRGKEFTFVYLNDERLSFTTELGKNWELWMAYRELYSNTLDENGRVEQEMLDLSNQDEPITQIVVTGASFTAIDANRGQYFILPEEKPIWSNHRIEVYPGPTHSVFYRGIRVSHDQRHTYKYKYNIRDNLSLTEDRTVKYSFELSGAIARMVAQVEDEGVLKSLVRRRPGTRETLYAESATLSYISNYTPGDTFIRVIGKMCETELEYVDNFAAAHYRRHALKNHGPKEYKLTSIEQSALNRAINILEAAGHAVRDYPINIVETLGEGILGKGEDGIITLSREAFDHGVKSLVGTILEEFIHVHRRLYDESRAMQDYLLRLYINALEENLGERF